MHTTDSDEVALTEAVRAIIKRAESERLACAIGKLHPGKGWLRSPAGALKIEGQPTPVPLTQELAIALLLS